MPAKHATRLFGPARLMLSFAVAVLVLLVVWVAVRAVGPAQASRQPTVTLPSMPVMPLPSPSASPSASAAVASTPPHRSPSASVSGSKHSSRPTRAASRPSRAVTTAPKPAPRNDLAAALVVGASWEQGYIGAVRVTNNGSSALDWKVTVSHSGLTGLRLAGVWNAKGSQQGNDLIFTGSALAPGRSTTFGYQTAKTGTGKARPSGCAVLGGACTMR